MNTAEINSHNYGLCELCLILQKSTVSYKHILTPMKISLYLVATILLISLASAQVCKSNHWSCWNQIIKNNNNQRPTPKPATNSSRKAGNIGTFSWIRKTDQLTYRSSQYTYTLNMNSSCTIFCGLQAFPHYDQNGQLFCMRNPYFWNGMYNTGGRLYTKLCIPSVPKSNSFYCNAATNTLNQYYPSCSQASLPTYHKNSGNDCCYENFNAYAGAFNDQVDFDPNTLYDNIKLPAYLYNTG